MNTPNFDPGPPADVTVVREGDRWTLVFVRNLRHSPQAVWGALVQPDQLRQWAPFDADRDLGSEGAATLTMIDGEVAQDLPAQVRHVEPPRVLEYTWGDDVLRWELDATDAGTRLTLRHTIDDRDMVPKVAAGWHLCVVVAERLLDGAPIGPIRGADAMDYGWKSLRDAYATTLDIPVTD
jgi:uncharacterized protein YndB with AHSA1/START domain